MRDSLTTENGQKFLKVLREVQDDLRSGKIDRAHFDMSRVVSECGTIGCLAGHMVLKMGIAPSQYFEFPGTNFPVRHFDVAFEHNETDGLFEPATTVGLRYGANEHFYTPENAVEVIDLWVEGDNEPWKTLYVEQGYNL